jgi:PAS domain S-box-containing protein
MGASEHDPLFRRAFEEAGIAMALIGLDGRWLHVNRALCQLVGYDADELLQLTIKDITHPDDIGTDLQNLQDLLDGKFESYQTEKRYSHRFGHFVPIVLTTSLLRDNEGRPCLFIAQIQELKALKTPAPAEGMFELPVALHFVAGFDRYFKKLSRSWSVVLGHPLETLLSRPFMDFVHPDDRQRTLDESASVESGREAVLFENRYRHANGSYRWLLWTAIPVVAEKLIYGVAIDHTARKKVELELHGALQDQRRLYNELHAATSRIQELRTGLVKICAWTKRVYHDGRWIPTDEFLRDHLQLNVTHGMSEEGAEKFLSDMAVDTSFRSKPYPNER